MFLNSSAKVHNNFDMRKYSIIKLLCLTMFKLSIYEKVENKREKAPMLHAPGLICIPFYLFEIPFPFRTERTL